MDHVPKGSNECSPLEESLNVDVMHQMSASRASLVITLCLASFWPACGSKLRSRANASPEVIPNLIFFTGPWKPEAVVDGSRKVVPPGTEFRFYDDAQMAQSVNDISQELMMHGVFGAANAFQELRPAAFKADLWRYMILWQQGGIYLDAKIMLTAPLASWVNQQSDEMAICWDDPGAYAGGHGAFYWNAMLAARKHNPKLLSIIKKVISNVQRHYYGEFEAISGHKDLSITGPILMTRVLNSTDTNIKVGSVPPRASCTFLGNARGKVVGRDGLKIAEENKGVHKAMRHCEHCEPYGVLFTKRQVYCSEPGPPCSFLSLLEGEHEAVGKHRSKGYRSWIV